RLLGELAQLGLHLLAELARQNGEHFDLDLVVLGGTRGAPGSEQEESNDGEKARHGRHGYRGAQIIGASWALGSAGTSGNRPARSEPTPKYTISSACASRTMESPSGCSPTRSSRAAASGRLMMRTSSADAMAYGSSSPGEPGTTSGSPSGASRHGFCGPGIARIRVAAVASRPAVPSHPAQARRGGVASGAIRSNAPDHCSRLGGCGRTV